MAQIHFYASKDDLLPALQAAEAALAVDYFETGLFDRSVAASVDRAIMLPQLGEADADSAVACRTFLLMPAGRGLSVRKVGCRWAVDQLENAGSAMLTPAGRRGEALIAGRLSTVHDDVDSKALMRVFGGAIRKRFRKVKSFWIGDAAMACLGSGARLTEALQSPLIYDLVP